MLRRNSLGVSAYKSRACLVPMIMTIIMMRPAGLGRARLWHRHCRQMPMRLYRTSKGGRDLWKMVSKYFEHTLVTNVICIVSTKLSIFALKHQFHT